MQLSGPSTELLLSLAFTSIQQTKLMVNREFGQLEHTPAGGG